MDGFVEELDPEQAVAIISTDAGITTAHLPKNLIMPTPLVVRVDIVDLATSDERRKGPNDPTS